MKKIKNNLFSIGLTFSMILGLSFSFLPQETEAAPCPTGYSSVSTSWFSPSNDTVYTMCGCQAISGYSAAGSCGGSGGETTWNHNTHL